MESRRISYKHVESTPNKETNLQLVVRSSQPYSRSYNFHPSYIK